MDPTHRPIAAPGASARLRQGVLPAEVVLAGPPPAPVLAAPWAVRPVEPEGEELARVVRWMAEPHVAAWWRQDWPAALWSEEVARQRGGDHSRPWVLYLGRDPVAYIELYRVARDVIADAIPVDPHDLGIHLAVGERARTGRGLGRALLAAVADGLRAADPACRRVLGDPAADHHAARRAFAAAGFSLVAEVDLPHKRAALVARPC